MSHECPPVAHCWRQLKLTSRAQCSWPGDGNAWRTVLRLWQLCLSVILSWYASQHLRAFSSSLLARDDKNLLSY
jgi:hypothetical protein